MTIAELHWELDFRYNKLNTNSKIQLTPLEKDSILNNALNRLITLAYKGMPNTRIEQGYEIDQQNRDILSTFTVKETISYPPSNIFNLMDLSHLYLHYANIKLHSNCGEFNVTVVQHDDIEMFKKDSFKAPSKQWKRALAVFYNNSIEFFIPAGVTFNSFTITYLRQPVKMFFGNYNTPNFTYSGYNSVEFNTSQSGYQATDPPVQCELHEGYHNLLLDFAIEIVSKITYDTFQVQSSQDSIMKTL